jgi:hypothetical protein
MSHDLGQGCSAGGGLTDRVAVIGSTCAGARSAAATATVSGTAWRWHWKRNGCSTGCMAVRVQSDDGRLINNVSRVRFSIKKLLQRAVVRGIDAAKFWANRARNGRDCYVERVCRVDQG